MNMDTHWLKALGHANTIALSIPTSHYSQSQPQSTQGNPSQLTYSTLVDMHG